MSRTERVELTTLCLVHNEDAYLLQNRVKEDWKGYTLPGGHIEIGESIVDAIVREIKEETGLTILNPKLCGVKQFQYILKYFHINSLKNNFLSVVHFFSDIIFESFFCIKFS